MVGGEKPPTLIQIHKMANKMSLQDFIDKFIVDGIKPVVDNQPYLAFILLSSAIEFLGKCMNDSNDWHKHGNSEYNFCNAIQTFTSFKEYKQAFGKNTTVKGHKDVYENSLYWELRCAMVHALQPRSGIVLREGNNDLANNTLGCKDLYEDVIKAYEEVKAMYPNRTVSIYINGSETGATPTTITKIQSHTDK